MVERTATGDGAVFARATAIVRPSRRAAARWLPLLAAFAAAVVVLAGVAVVDRAEQQQFQQGQREEVLYQVSAARAGLEKALHTRLSLVHSLAAQMVANPSLQPGDFELFARRMRSLQPDAGRLALARGTTITDVYPLERDEALVGVDLASLPEWRDAVLRALSTGQLVVGDPAYLATSGADVVAYLPIVLPNAEHGTTDPFWGLALLFMQIEPLLDEAGIADGAAGLRWALRGRDGIGAQGEVFFGDPGLFEASPVALDVALPGGAWRLAAVPIGGWSATAPSSWWIRGGGGLLAMLVGSLVYFLVRDPTRLREAVDRATAAVAASERRFRALIDNSSDLIVLLDRQGTNLFASPSAARLLGYRPGELLGRSAFEIVHGDDREATAAVFDALVERPGQSTAARYRLRTVDGSWRWMEAVATNLLDDPSVGAVVVNCRDVTEQVEAYEALEERVRERTRELAGLLDVSRAVASSLEFDAVVELILEQTRQVLDYTGVRLWLVEGDEIVLLAERGPQERPGAVGSRSPLASRFVVHEACRRRRALVVPSAAEDTPLARGLRAGMEAVGDRSLEYVQSFVIAPLVARDRVVGALTFGHAEPNRYTERHAELAMAFANQAAVAFENARLHDQAAQRLRDLEVLYQADERLHHSLNAEDVFAALVDVAHAIMGADKTALLVWDADGERLRTAAHRGWRTKVVEQVSFALGEGNVGRVAATGEPLVVEDLASHPNAHRVILEEEDVRSCIHVPVRLEGRVLGVFNVNYTTPRSFSAGDQRLVTALAQRAALAIGNAGLHEQSERRSREVEALHRADEVLHRSLRLSDVLQAFVDVAADILAADKTSILVWDERRERLVIGAMHGFGPEMARLSLEPGQGIAGVVASTRQPVVVEDAPADPRVVRTVVDREGVRSLMAIPILLGDEVFGVFGVNYCQSHRFTSEEQRTLLGLAQRTALAIENAHLYEQAQQAAALEERQRLARDLHDAVTQTLFSASLIAEALPKIWQRDPAAGAERTEELRQLTRGALAEMRMLLLELRPSALAEANLDQLLHQLGDAVAGRTRVPVAVSAEVHGKLPAEVQVAFFRVAQEALNNAAKHADASRVEVRVHSSGDCADLTIRDDGRGFDPSSVPGGHFGLGMMRERAEAIDARVEVTSAPGQGTTVALSWTNTESRREQ